jgi:hypothetical protein
MFSLVFLYSVDLYLVVDAFMLIIQWVPKNITPWGISQPSGVAVCGTVMGGPRLFNSVRLWVSI